MLESVIKLKNFASARRGLASGLLLLLSLLWPPAAWSQTETQSLDAGFRRMYNLEFEAAHTIFDKWEDMHPDDPLGPASSAAAYLFSEFDRLRILEMELFTDTKRLQKGRKLIPDPQVKSAFESKLAKADSIASDVLTLSPGEPNALFAQVLISGLRGDYAALIERRNKEGLDHLKSSRSTAEKLLAIDPSYYDAYLAIGIENYVVGLRSAPVRWVLRMSGAQTNKNEGIANLKITAEKGRYLAPYARILLAIAALRDNDPRTSRELLSGLVEEFPQNRLYRAELARLR
jgi:hypothetical protein